ncbi:MAG: NADH-ubiquinone oxidoreductase chain K, partial [uncultured Actinomycetospora sp.]
EPDDLPAALGAAARHRRGRRARAAQRHRRVHVHRADAQRREPDARDVLPDQRVAQWPDHGVLRHGRGRGGGRRRPLHHHGDLPHPSDHLGRRRQPAEVL